MRQILVSDFTIKEVSHGGSEWVNQVVMDRFPDLEFWYSQQVTEWDKDAFYIISNISLMNQALVRQIPSLNYIILENDYKICHSRHPWRWPNSLVPHNERINYDIYANAKAVFVQTTDHMNVYKANDVKANFINLNCSIWSDSDLALLQSFLRKKPLKNGKQAVYSTGNWIKNTEGAVKYCAENKLEAVQIENQEKREDFLDKLSDCSGLVFFPIARETFCRLLVEAKCLGLKVTTNKNSGAAMENWFGMEGEDLLKFLKIKTEINLKKIGEYIK
jgi:hypothetical protein